MLMWEYSKSWGSHAVLISGWTTKHARRILEEVVWSGSSESLFRSTYFRYACLTESKSRGFWVAHSASWKKKHLAVFLVFCSRKQMVLTFSAMLAVQSQRAGVSQRYLQQRSFGASVHFVEKTWWSHSMKKCGDFRSYVPLLHLYSKRSHAQVSIGYLLSIDFAQLAIQRTGRDDPTFIDTCFGTTLLT